MYAAFCLPAQPCDRKRHDKGFEKRYPNANIVPVDYDPGASEVNQLNRIKLMLAAAFRNMEETGTAVGLGHEAAVAKARRKGNAPPTKTAARSSEPYADLVRLLQILACDVKKGGNNV